jgi:hypothetical protein
LLTGCSTLGNIHKHFPFKARGYPDPFGNCGVDGKIKKGLLQPLMMYLLLAEAITIDYLAALKPTCAAYPKVDGGILCHELNPSPGN